MAEPSAPSAPEPEEVSAALGRRLAGRFGGAVADAEAPVRISGGLDFWVYGLSFAGPGLPGQWAAPLVARIAAMPERFPLLEWAGEWSLADNRLRLPRRLAADGSVPGLAEGLERTERLLPRLEVSSPAVCHGDFQPGNVLVDGDVPGLSVIDWTDAGVGDRHGDVARTAWVFYLAAAAATDPGRRVALRALAPVVSRAYLSAYRRELPVDAGRLRLWLPVHLLHAWAMAAADELGRSGPRRLRAGLAEWARREFWRRIDELG